MVKRREDCNTYLTHVCRHHYSGENPVKRWNIRSANTVAFISCNCFYRLWKPQRWLKAPLSFHQVLYASLMSTDMSQVGVTLFPSFTFPSFPFILINNSVKMFSIDSPHIVILFLEVLCYRWLPRDSPAPAEWLVVSHATFQRWWFTVAYFPPVLLGKNQHRT